MVWPAASNYASCSRRKFPRARRRGAVESQANKLVTNASIAVTLHVRGGSAGNGLKSVTPDYYQPGLGEHGAGRLLVAGTCRCRGQEGWRYQRRPLSVRISGGEQTHLYALQTVGLRVIENTVVANDCAAAAQTESMPTLCRLRAPDDGEGRGGST